MNKLKSRHDERGAVPDKRRRCSSSVRSVKKGRLSVPMRTMSWNSSSSLRWAGATSAVRADHESHRHTVYHAAAELGLKELS